MPSRRSAILLTVFALVALVFASGIAEGGSPGSDPADPVIAAVGDIACKNPPGNNRRACRYDDVAALVAAGNYDRFLVLGDEQYEYGRLKDFRQNYDVYFGDLNSISEPVPGNHEYGTANASGYFRYFGSIARGPGGYYSYDLGAWHVIALNSAICPAAVGCGPGDPQYEWLRNDLAAHADARCTLAYWHHPRFDWLKYQHADWTEDYEFLRSAPFWDLLDAAGADVVLNGHNHNYSHWLPMDSTGAYDPNGITQFIAGTGGRNLNDFGAPSTKPVTFLTGQSDEFGILRMTLHPTGYSYDFVSTKGANSTYIDQGSGTCH